MSPEDKPSIQKPTLDIPVPNLSPVPEKQPAVEDKEKEMPKELVAEEPAAEKPEKPKTPEMVEIPPQYITPSKALYNIPNPLSKALRAPEHDDKWLELFVTDKVMQEAWQRTMDLDQQIKDNISRANVAESLLVMLMQARRHLLAGKTQFDEANSLLHSVEYSVHYYQQSYEDSRKHAWWIFLYETLWLIGMLVLTMWILRLNGLPDNNPQLSTTMQQFLGVISADQLLKSLAWGSLGGVAGAMHALWRHVAKLHDFSRRYNLWYITMPILGFGLGGFVYLIFQAGFFSLVGGVQSGIDIKSPYMIYLVAWAVGFKQNVVYNLVRRVIDVIYPPAYEKTEEESIDL